MINIKYAKYGQVVSDHMLEDWGGALVERFKKEPNFGITVGAETMVTMVRVLIVRGELKHTDVVFHDGSSYDELTVNEYGNLKVWPPGFCDKTINLMVELLEAGRRSRKIRKEICGDNLY